MKYIEKKDYDPYIDFIMPNVQNSNAIYFRLGVCQDVDHFIPLKKVFIVEN